MTGWHRWFGTFTGIVGLTVAALPVAVLVGWALARHRRAGGATPSWALRSSLAEVGMILGTVPMVWMILLPGSRAGRGPGRVSLIPLRDLATILTHDGPVAATVQIVGNLIPFAALGFFGPMRFTALASIPRILALGAACSIVVETAQYVFQLDRVSSVDDVLLNTVGAGLAALASHRWWRTRVSAETVPA